jgi:hypothetical protein
MIVHSKTALASFALLLSITVAAQTAPNGSPQEYKAELSVPFGVSQGRLIAAGDQLVFFDDSKPGASLVIARSNLDNLTSDGVTVTAQLRTPIQDSGGDRTQLSFRLPDASAANAVAAWFNQRPASAPNVASDNEKSYPAHHKKKFVHDTSGRLIVGRTGVAYESVDDVNDSRRWENKDIKELKLKSPYQLDLVPFTGDSYTFSLEGSGMDTAAYQQLVDRVTRSRASK